MKYNTKYGKLEDTLYYAPNKLIIDGEQVFNADAETYLAFGYYPIIETEEPALVEGYYYEPYYIQTETAIELRWNLVEIPVDDEATEADYLEALARLGVE